MKNIWGFSVLDPTTTCELSVAYGVVPSELAPPLLPATREGSQSCWKVRTLDTSLQWICIIYTSHLLHTLRCHGHGFFLLSHDRSCVIFCFPQWANVVVADGPLQHVIPNMRIAPYLWVATSTTLERLSPWLLLWDVEFQWKRGIRGRHGRNPTRE